VKKDEPLLAIYSPELVSAEEEYIIALKYRNIDPKQNEQAELFERAHRKLMFWDIPHEQIVRLETTKKPEKTMTLVSPTTGVVVEKNVLKGGNIMAGTNLYKIADLSTVWVYADVYEYEVPFIKVGQQATVTLAYTPGKIFKGRVSYIYPYLNADTRTARVRIEIPNPNAVLKPEMFATVELQSSVAINAVAVPEQAVIHSGERNVVVISRGDGRFESRDVKLGVLAGGYYQVLDGVREGEKIVVSSQFLLDSESNLKAALQQMSHDQVPIDSASMKQQIPGHKMEEMKADSSAQHQHGSH
jgi:multidrug efflux pump subunit AcrA (membrane-fusion protein)